MKTFMLIAAAVWAFVLPGVCLIIWKKKTGAPVKPFIVGALTFLIFAMGLEQVMHAFCLPLVMDRPVLYVIYAALAAGVFEETGRFLAFSTVLKKNTEKLNSVAYGIGHGGIEVILILGVNYLTVLIVMLTNNEELMSVLAPSIAQISPGIVAVAMTERVFALLFHICASVLVFVSVHDRSRRWYFPLAILLHALLDLPAAIYQQGKLSIAAVEILTAVYTVTFALIVKKIYSGYKDCKTEEIIE